MRKGQKKERRRSWLHSIFPTYCTVLHTQQVGRLSHSQAKEPTRSPETSEIRVTSATWLWDVTRLGRAKRVVQGWRKNTEQKKQCSLARGQIFMLASRFLRTSHRGGQGSIPGHPIGGAWRKLRLLRVHQIPRVNSYTIKARYSYSIIYRRLAPRLRGWTSWVQIPEGLKYFLFSKTVRPALGPLPVSY